MVEDANPSSSTLGWQTADDCSEVRKKSPQAEKLIAASIQWAEKIMEKIDERLLASSCPHRL